MDKGYVISSIRQQLLAHGCVLQEETGGTQISGVLPMGLKCDGVACRLESRGIHTANDASAHNQDAEMYLWHKLCPHFPS